MPLIQRTWVINNLSILCCMLFGVLHGDGGQNDLTCMQPHIWSKAIIELKMLSSNLGCDWFMELSDITN